MNDARAFSSLTAVERARVVVDPGTFVPLANAPSRTPLVVGSGSIAGEPVLLALLDGHVQGGTMGVREAGILARVAESAAARRPAALVLGFDTGGVRVDEGPRALAAACAAGVALARLTLLGVRTAAVISGPRGCFGAPAVMAALPEHVIMTEEAHWGLTGPKLLGGLVEGTGNGGDGLAATSAAVRLGNGDVQALVPDAPAAVRAQLCELLADRRVGGEARTMEQWIATSARVAAGLQARLRAARATPPPRAETVPPRRRDLLRYSFRGQWKPTGPMQRAGLVHAAMGTLGPRPALGFIVGPEQTRGGGVGIEEAAVVTDMLRLAAHAPAAAARAAVLTFLFCQGHAVDIAQERYGLPRALAECLRAMVAARRLGHPLVSVLGGGTYGAAYLALAAPSHRILAIRGTSVAPMAPAVLRAFQALRGRKSELPETPLAELIPDIRIVESVIRLPRVLRDELTTLIETVRPEVEEG